MYANIPAPPQSTNMISNNLTIVGSISKYSANPPQTPQSFLLILERYNFFIALFIFEFLYNMQIYEKIILSYICFLKFLK